MIQRVSISNFQSHKNTVLDLVPGVNVIVGASDSGKTAILRALRWLIWNRPSGEAFRSTWGGDTKVDIEAEHRHWFRSKGKENLYHYNGSTFAAFGSDVPPEVSESLNINESNFQTQLTPHFLISESPGDVAKYFNQVAHLDQIDIGLKRLNSNLRLLDNKHGFLIEQRSELEEAIKQYDHLEKTEIDLEVIEAMSHRRDVKILAVNRLRVLVNALDFAEMEEARLKRITDLHEKVLVIYANLHDLNQKRDQRNALRNHIAAIRSTVSEIIQARKIARHKPAAEELTERYNALVSRVTEYNGLNRLLKQMEENAEDLIQTQSNIEVGRDVFAANMPEYCPLCNTKLSDDKDHE